MKNIENIKLFMESIENNIDEPIPEPLTPETRFRDIEDWDSLRSLVVVVGLSENYGVSISDQEFAKTQTVQDLYDLVSRKRECQ